MKLPFLRPAAVVAPVLAVLASCSSPAEPHDPALVLGQTFPSVKGTSLEGETVRIPEDFAGEPTLILIGLLQDAQFDADRWLFGLLDAELDVRVVEMPTLKGAAVRMFGNTIDQGMRNGIPANEWGNVVTVYRDAGPVVKFTGNGNKRNMRVVLLDADGEAVFFHDQGFSAPTLIRLREALRALPGG